VKTGVFRVRKCSVSHSGSSFDRLSKVVKIDEQLRENDEFAMRQAPGLVAANVGPDDGPLGVGMVCPILPVRSAGGGMPRASAGERNPAAAGGRLAGVGLRGWTRGRKDAGGG
jgi:hypothetical protein